MPNLRPVYAERSRKLARFHVRSKAAELIWDKRAAPMLERVGYGIAGA